MVNYKIYKDHKVIKEDQSTSQRRSNCHLAHRYGFENELV